MFINRDTNGEGVLKVGTTLIRVSTVMGILYRTYDAIQYAYANLLSEAEEVKSFQVNVLLQGLEEGAYTSDFVITKADGNLMVRECVSRKHLTKPMTTTLLDASRNYWKSHGVSDWGIVIEEEV